jgi:threonine/homoserine/homoserine lactone efflux protein
MLSTPLAFLGACTLIAASPGPSTVLIIKESLRSRRAGFLTVLGNETGVFVRGVVAALGLTTLLAASELAYDVMRIVGAVVLVVFGVQTLWQANRAARQRARRSARAPTPCGNGVACTAADGQDAARRACRALPQGTPSPRRHG